LQNHFRDIFYDIDRKIADAYIFLILGTSANFSSANGSHYDFIESSPIYKRLRRETFPVVAGETDSTEQLAHL
jgi:hypothetical protein